MTRWLTRQLDVCVCVEKQHRFCSTFRSSKSEGETKCVAFLHFNIPKQWNHEARSPGGAA